MGRNYRIRETVLKGSMENIHWMPFYKNFYRQQWITVSRKKRKLGEYTFVLLIKIKTMKQPYYVNNNEQSNGDHEVHVSTCYYFARMYSRMYLGEFETCQEAVREARKHYQKVNGCLTCCKPCHTS